jgi:hypothetical protein
MAMTPFRTDVIRIVAEVALLMVIATTAGYLIAAGGLRGPLASLPASLAAFAILLGLTLLFRAGRQLYRRFKNGN